MKLIIAGFALYCIIYIIRSKPQFYFKVEKSNRNRLNLISIKEILWLKNRFFEEKAMFNINIGYNSPDNNPNELFGLSMGILRRERFWVGFQLEKSGLISLSMNYQTRGEIYSKYLGSYIVDQLVICSFVIDNGSFICHLEGNNPVEIKKLSTIYNNLPVLSNKTGLKLKGNLNNKTVITINF